MNYKKETIKELRERLGFTQRELGELIGVNQVTVNRWENGKYKPSKLALEKLNKLTRSTPRKTHETQQDAQ